MRRLPCPDSGRDMLVACLLLIALHQGAGAASIQAKAWLAPILIERAWSRTLAGASAQRPWPWADTWPVARLRAPAHGVELFVLAGDSGNALAFGPGHALASAPPGGPGLTVIGGHRDTHFAFLRDVAPGDRLELQLPGGATRTYRVESARVVHSEREPLTAGSREGLLLVTCYPFDALRPGGPLRYTVLAYPRERTAALL